MGDAPEGVPRDSTPTSQAKVGRMTTSMSAISAEDRIYREFACWAARRAARISKCKSNYPIVLVVEQYLRGEVGFDEVIAARKIDNAQTVGAIGAAGLRSRAGGVKVLNLISPALAAHLAASGCAADSARQAADSAIKYGALTARNANRWSVASSEGKEKTFLEAELRNRLESL